MRVERVLFTVCLSWIMGCAAAQRVAQGVLISHDYLDVAKIAEAQMASTPVESSLPDKSIPQLSVRVYSFPGLSGRLLQASEIETARLLRDVPVEINWVNCISRLEPAACISEPAPTDLIVRVLAKALPWVSAHALGIAGSKREYASAFIFYDRTIALRTQASSLPSIVGRVLAHEIVHVLLPDERHSDFGLMRGQWSAGRFEDG